MGQYYTPIIMEEGKRNKAYLSHNYGSGLKLMEHSYIGNKFVQTVMMELLNKPGRLAWVGDYAEVNEDDCINPDLTKELKGKFIKYEKNDKKKYKKCNYHFEEDTDLKGYIVNHTKKEFIDLSIYVTVCKKEECNWDGETYYMMIHPLPLLTAIGNGKGGGDYGNKKQGDGYDYKVSYWAGDIIEYKEGFNNENNYKEMSKELDFYEEGYK